jgi:cyclophilin family peptidyl-prolyl cis-trans isomerase
MLKIRTPHLLFSVLLGAIINSPLWATVVRMDFSLGEQAADPVYVELLDLEAPVTVANFLNYVESSDGDRRYDSTFIHRSITDFVVQGGGFAYDPALGDFGPASAPHIATDPPIVNEFDASRSNLRGTVAMAKLGDDPDSATSEWFFNLADNSANLDNQNGGFTVFARVLGNGMAVIDSIAALPIEDQGGAFTDIPLANHNPGDPVADANLVKLTRIEVVEPVQPSLLDYGLVPLGGASSDSILIQNLTEAPMAIDPIAPDALASPFSIDSESCSAAVLAPTQTCSIDISFRPLEAGRRQVSFTLLTDSDSFPSLTVSVTGTGAPQAPTLSLSLADSLDFGDIGPGDDRQLGITLSNNGIDPLTIRSVGFIGSGSENFSTTANCANLNFGESCTESLTFRAVAPGEPDVQLEIQSDDASAPRTLVPVLATASSDNDGIPDAIEAAAPNGGDGNRDGIADIIQSHVTSIPNINARYVTLETQPGIRIIDALGIENPSPDDTPRLGSGSLAFRHGFYLFTLVGVPVGGSATLTLYLPEGQSPSHYFKFGRLPGDFFLFPPRWYDFTFNGETGAEFQGNRVTLHFVDGGRGDNDQAANGRIVDPGGPAVASTTSSSSSGGGGGCTLSQSESGRANHAVDFIALLLCLLALQRSQRRHYAR